jgi:hypothetical protein
MQVSVCGCELSLLCVCVYRCVHLKELTIEYFDSSGSFDNYDGICMVITHCKQLRILRLECIDDITGKSPLLQGFSAPRLMQPFVR